jgi:drug/metabolite transporter (DMT)-like permease
VRRDPVPLVLAAVSVIWGANYQINKWGLGELDVVTFNAVRFVLAGPLLLAVTIATERAAGIAVRHWARLLASTVVGIVGYQLAFSESVHLTSPTESAILIALSPFAAAAFAAMAREPGRRPGILLDCAVALAGAVMVILGSGGAAGIARDHLLGDAVALVAAVLWGLYPVITRPLLAHYTPVRVTAWAACLGGGGLAVLAAPRLATLDPSGYAPATWASLVYSVLAVTVFGLVAWYHGVRRIGSSASMVFMFAVPVAAAAFAAVAGTQRLTWWHAAGAMLVLGALAHAHGLVPLRLTTRSNA